ncbi:MAG: YbaL family putative K(+) efflux transporter [Acetobacteraceae bacterium]|nr:YbaL family putative K(+) efflux transporter [Acetobacteraceae bacterium]
MHTDSPLIDIVVVGIGLAFVFGALANRLKTSLLAGYLVAGVAVGPFTPGFVADPALALQLAEIGVILLMFGVGLHFSVDDLLSVRRVAIPGALGQLAVATLLGIGLARLFGWPMGAGVVFGLCLSVASTVVLLRSLQDRRLMETRRGHIAVGWLVTQDLVTVLALVLLPPLAGLLKGSTALSTEAIGVTLAITLGKVVAFVALMLIVGRRVIPAVLHYVAHTGSRELFRLAVLAVALVVAFVATEVFGVSFALGAFVAGMVLNESQLSQRAAEETLPLRDAFAVLFFVSVGMLFNPAVLVTHPLPLLATMAVIGIGTPLTALLLVRTLGETWSTAALLAVGLAQIGEFSFLLADLGIGLDLLPAMARDLILGASILLILLNPLLFVGLDRLRPWLERLDVHPVPEPAAQVAEPEHEGLPMTHLTDHAVLVGCGRVGSLVAEGLLHAAWPLLVIEAGDDTIERFRGRPVEVISGNAADPAVLQAANLPEARLLLVAIPEAFEAGQIVEQARIANPSLRIIARAHFDEAVEHLDRHGATVVVMGEREIARAMLDHADKPATA